jgi:hypothetical protein
MKALVYFTSAAQRLRSKNASNLTLQTVRFLQNTRRKKASDLIRYLYEALCAYADPFKPFIIFMHLN